ncbi:MAG TPA: hypothetical protein VKB63_11200, partial [Gemmatimonadales bacterium]|nr:hypothetical protein [Gemmatimonadales bacterium]
MVGETEHATLLSSCKLPAVAAANLYDACDEFFYSARNGDACGTFSHESVAMNGHDAPTTVR